jgi:cytochrome c-type biogenesis protein CcmH/NrfG
LIINQRVLSLLASNTFSNSKINEISDWQSMMDKSIKITIKKNFS